MPRLCMRSLCGERFGGGDVLVGGIYWEGKWKCIAYVAYTLRCLYIPSVLGLRYSLVMLVNVGECAVYTNPINESPLLCQATMLEDEGCTDL